MKTPLHALVVFLFVISSLSEAKQKWIEVDSPHFLVVTNAGEKQARDTALHLERIRAFFRQSLTVAGHHPSPFVTVLAVKDEQTMRDILGRNLFSNAQPHLAGIFAERLDQYFALVELDVQRSGYYSTFYHEYYHAITLPAFPDLPVWLAEGLAEFYGRTDISDEYVGTGRPDSDLLDVLRQNRLIPLDVLFRVDHSSPYYNEANKVSIFYAESWLLTHYLMIGNPDAHRLLVSYLEALGQGKSWSEAATAFGDLKKLQADLSSYLWQKKFLYVNASPPKVDLGELKIRTLSEGEAEAYLGGVSAGLGHTQDALHRLTKAVKLDPNSSLAYEYLGMAQFLDGQRERAFESASQSVKLDPKNPSARYLRAYYALNGPAMLSTDAEVEEDLQEAIISNPEFSPAYVLLGLHLALQAHRSDEGLSLVKQALALDPSNSSYQLALARVLSQMNRSDEAKAAAIRANVLARNQEERIQVQKYAPPFDQEPPAQDQQSENYASPGGRHRYGNMEILSDTRGVDFGPYLERVLKDVKSNWYRLIPESAQMKKGKLAVDFAIMKDGRVQGLVVRASSGDSGLDKPAYGSIVASDPFPPLPSKFTGPYLQLRFRFYYNPDKADLE